MSSVSSGPKTSAIAPSLGPAAAPGGPRLGWLDALRGFAALCVVFDHGSQLLLTSVRDVLYNVLNLGQYGVFVFFLVSGYIVPASLERKGSVRSFWTSRAFRLYPMYALAIVLAAIGYATRHGDLAGAEHHPLTAMASWLVMMPDMLTGPNVPNVTWTLSYEMLFYLLLAALFTWRVHRHSGGYALGFAAGAVVLGGLLPMAALWHWTKHSSSGMFALDATADVLILGGIAFAVAGRGWTVRAGATVAALTALVLATVNQSYPYPWSQCTILALMFTGTLVYRAQQGQTGKLAAAWIAGAVLTLIIVAGLWHGVKEPHDHQWKVQWVSSIVLAAVTFVIGLAVANRRIPRAVAWLGMISYSVYLLHPLVFNAYRSFSALHRHHSMTGQVLYFGGLLAVIIAASALTYYTVEKPMQRLGRALDRRLARSGSGARYATGSGASAAQALSTSSSSAVAGGSGGSP